MSFRQSPTVRPFSFAPKLRLLICVLISLLFYTRETFSNGIHLGSNHQELNFTWDSSNQSFFNSGQAYPSQTIYENNHYIFYNNSDQSFYLSDTFNTNYSGNEVFNNGSSVNGEYIVFSPESNGSDSRSFYYYNPNNLSGNGSISIIPYGQSSLIQGSTINQEANLGSSLYYNESNQLIVGARGENTYTGKIYIFEHTTDLNFSRVQEISPPVSENLMNFGASITGSGNHLIVGAPNYSSYQGIAFLYQRGADGLYSDTGIQVSDASPSAGDIFGGKMKMHSGVLAIGSTQLNQNNGKVSLFNVSGNVVNHTATMIAGDGQLNDKFGHDLDLDGSLLLVGAPDADGLSSQNSGAAYLFEKNSDGNWSQTQKLTPSTLSANDNFGYSVAISGNLIFVGAYKGDGAGVDTGTIYVFEKTGSNNAWTEVAMVDAPTTSSDQLFSTDIIAVGDLLISSAPAAGTHGLTYVFERQDQNSSSWKLISSLDANQSSVTAGNTTSAPLAWGEGKIILGSPDDNSTVDAGGAFQMFQNPAWTETFKLPSLKPLYDQTPPSSIEVNEDGLSVSFDFNGSHPFESALTSMVF